MVTETGIAPEVGEHIAAVNRQRIEKNTDFRYHRVFWGGYKQHVHELMVGITVGSGVGALAGLGALLLFPVLGPAAIIVGAATGLGYAAEKISSIGASSGAHAASLAEKHARELDPENNGDPLSIANDRLMNGTGGHHYEFGEEGQKKRFFYWKSGLLGALIGAGSGALLGVGGEAIPVIAHLVGVTALAGLFGAAAPIAIGAIAFGLLGLTYGIDRGVFKSIFNRIDTFITGRKIVTDHGKEQAHAKGLSDDDLAKRRVERQENIHALQDAYDKNIFMGGMRGFLKGLAGGITVGALIGAAVGLAVLGVLAVVAAPVLVTAAPIIMTASLTGFAGYFGTVFSEAGYNAGTEAATRAIDDELPRSQAAARGIPQPANPDLYTRDRGIIGNTFDGVLAGIRKVSEASKNVYNQVNDYPPSIQDEIIAEAKANRMARASQITQEDMRKMEKKMSDKNAPCPPDDKQTDEKNFTSGVTSKNINDIIKESSPSYPDFTTMLANQQKADYTATLQNKN